MTYSEARPIAELLVGELMEHCVPGMIHIAGSVRREKPECGDIEIVCLPLPYDTGMFASGIATVIEPMEKVRGNLPCRYTQRIVKIKHDRGFSMQSTVTRIVLDLFMPQEHDYFRQLAIRTGPAEYSGKVIASAWRRKGWVGTEDGLRLESECEKISDRWKCMVINPVLPPAWKSEEEFFAWLGVKYVDPKNRYSP